MSSALARTLELTPFGAGQDSRYTEIDCNTHAVERLLVTLFLQANPAPPSRIALDLDATDDPIYGHQRGGWRRLSVGIPRDRHACT